MRIQGWYRDPFGSHNHRWVSDGRATSLVRDGDTESYDPPRPEGPAVPASQWQPAPDPFDEWDESAAERPGNPGPDRRPLVRGLILFAAVFLSTFLLFGLYVIVWMGSH